MTSRRRNSGVTAGLYADRGDGAACVFPELAIGDVNRILDRRASGEQLRTEQAGLGAVLRRDSLAKQWDSQQRAP